MMEEEEIRASELRLKKCTTEPSRRRVASALPAGVARSWPPDSSGQREDLAACIKVGVGAAELPSGPERAICHLLAR